MQRRALLLDTHILLWLLADDRQLGRKSRNRISQEWAVSYSAASAWEPAIKSMLGKLLVPDSFDAALGCLRSG